jgi:hypothetical protein
MDNVQKNNIFINVSSSQNLNLNIQYFLEESVIFYK